MIISGLAIAAITPPAVVDAMYVQMDMRESDPNAHMVAQVGGDWWRSDSAPFLGDFSNNPGAGGTNWVELTTRYQTIGFSSMDMPTFEAHLSNLSGLFDAAPPPPAAAGRYNAARRAAKFRIRARYRSRRRRHHYRQKSDVKRACGSRQHRTVMEGSATIGTAHAAADGHWDIATARLSRGDHDFVATATDAAGNISDPSALDVTWLVIIGLFERHHIRVLLLYMTPSSSLQTAAG